MMKRWILFIVIVVPILYLLSFSLMRNPSLLPSALIGKKLPEFSLMRMDGRVVKSSELTGKPLLINFWSTWCGPCAYEHPMLLAARENYRDKVEFLGIVYQDSKENVVAFVKEMGEPFQIFLDSQSQAAIQFGVGGVPETFFVDALGVIREKHSGVLTVEELEKYLQGLQP